MKSLRFLPLLLVFAVLLVAAGCGGGSAGVPSDSVAVVNGDSITKVQFNTLMNATTKVDKANKQTPPAAGTTAYKTRQDQILAYLVQLDELTQKGKTLGIEVTDAQVQQQVDKVKKQYFKGDEKKFEAGLLAQGLTLPIYELEWRAQLLSNKIYAKVTKGIKVTDAQVTAYYGTHKSSYTTKASRDVRHILVNSKSLADKLETQLKAGADFAKLAKKYSKDASSARAGRQADDHEGRDRSAVRQGRVLDQDERHLRARALAIRLAHHRGAVRGSPREGDAAREREADDPADASAVEEDGRDERVGRRREEGLREEDQLRGRVHAVRDDDDGNDRAGADDHRLTWRASRRPSSTCSG